MTQNTMKTTTNRTAPTTAEQRANRREQITAVFTDYIRANKNKDYFFNMLYQNLLYEEAEKAVYIAIRARLNKSGLQFLADLQTAQANDRTARNNTIIAEQMSRLEQMHESHRKGYEFFNARANRLTLSDIERATAYTLAEDLRSKATAEQQQINALYDGLNKTLSDRADIVQDTALKLWQNDENPIEIADEVIEDYLHRHNLTDEDLTDLIIENIQKAVNFKDGINTAGKSISKLATPDALNRTTTKAEPITAEQVADYILTYGNEVLNGLQIPHQTKRASASQCYITIEERNTKTQKGFYKVTHYKTVAPYQSIEDFSTENEDGETDIAYLKSYNPFVSNYNDIELMEQLTADLTDRERKIVFDIAKAYRNHNNFVACRKWAFNQNGIHAERTIRHKWNEIKKQIEPRAKALNIIK